VPFSVFCLISKELLDTLQVFRVRNLCNSRNFRKLNGLKRRKPAKRATLSKQVSSEVLELAISIFQIDRINARAFLRYLCAP
jgi:hypothetical protein